MPQKKDAQECTISLRITGIKAGSEYGISLSFEARYLTILALIASVVSFVSLGAFVAVIGYIIGQYMRLTG